MLLSVTQCNYAIYAEFQYNLHTDYVSLPVVDRCQSRHLHCKQGSLSLFSCFRLMLSREPTLTLMASSCQLHADCCHSRHHLHCK